MNSTTATSITIPVIEESELCICKWFQNTNSGETTDSFNFDFSLPSSYSQQENQFFIDSTLNNCFPFPFDLSTPTFNATFDTPMSPSETSSNNSSHKDSPRVKSTIEKKKKNTEAARRSRARKNIHLDSLEQQLKDHESMKQQQTLRILLLEQERNNNIAKCIEYEKRIKELEKNLAENHEQIVKMYKKN